MKFTVSEYKPKGAVITGAYDLEPHFKKLAKADQESFWVVSLDAKHAIISMDMVSLGGINYASVDQRIVFKRVLTVGAVAMIVVHNHPSGSPEASPEDKNLTKKLKEIANMLDIRFLDHFIVAGDDFVRV